MRDIKFRYRITSAKGNFTDIDKAGGWKFAYFTLEEIEKSLTVLNHGLIRILSRDQYTGLKDKNGKDIYDGDIIRYRFGTGGELYDKNIFDVEWISNLTHNGWNVKEPASKRGFYEIIGNIYENPELLEEKQKKI